MKFHLSLLSVLALALAGCDTNIAPEDLGTTADTTDAGTEDVVEETTTDVVEEDAVEEDAVEEDTVEDTGDIPEGDAGADVPLDGDPPECDRNDDCATGEDCVDGICETRCGVSSECDDGNPCTSDGCTDGYCFVEVMDPPPNITDPEAGDCKTEVCLDGEIHEQPDSSDMPEDDGIFCTIESCAGAFPQHRPQDDLCDDGNEENGAEYCSIPERGCALGDLPEWFCEPLLPEWGPEELCDDGQDNDGNGLVDEGCVCAFGAATRCYGGPPSSRDVGGCLDGYMRCENRADPRWGECEGAILPDEEICDLKDNDCNGCVDDMEECDPLLSCPTEDFARPLRFYGLNAASIFDTDDAVIESVEWRLIPPANSATRGVESPGAVETQVYLDVSGDYQISLQLVTDKGVFGCSWVVHATGSGLRIEMRWDTFGSVDMDLHMHRSGTTRGFCSDDDCYYANCQTGGFSSGLDWGYPDSPSTECEGDGDACNNPRLDLDNISSFDPENINIDNPSEGDNFRVMAHMFSGSSRTNPVVSIYCGGRLRAVLGEDPDEVGLNRSGGGCGGQTWRVADVEMLVDADTGATDCSVFVLTDGDDGWDVRLSSSAH
jgi:hypothetical protein